MRLIHLKIINRVYWTCILHKAKHKSEVPYFLHVFVLEEEKDEIPLLLSEMIQAAIMLGRRVLVQYRKSVFIDIKG